MAGEVVKVCSTCKYQSTDKGCTLPLGPMECLGGGKRTYNLWESAVMAQPENSGAHATYYCITIHRPKSGGAAYMAECQDIIEALGMDFNEGNVFKALWRRAAARLGNVKKGNEDPLYDAQKIKFYGTRILEQEENK